MSRTAPPAPDWPFPVSWAIFSLARSHRGAAAALLAPLGLVPGQELLLFYLWREDGVPQKTLIELLGLDHSTVAKSIRRMETAGLVTRTRADHDRRVTLVHLTDAGRSLQGPVDAAWRELEERSVAPLSPAERRQLVDLADRVTTSVHTTPGAS